MGVLVLAAAVFGGWYSWYMRRRRKRNSISPSDRYSDSTMPSMTGLGGPIGGGAAAGMGAMAAVSGYRDTANRSDTRSELPSPPLPSPPPRSPDRLLPGAAAIRSWGTTSPPPHQGSSHMSVSDQSEYSQGNNQHLPFGTNQYQQPPPPVNTAAAGYFSNVNELPEDQRNIHEFPDDQISHPPSNQHYQPPATDADGYWSRQQSTQESYELPGQSPTPAPPAPGQGGGGAPYRGVDPEVPLHQRTEGRVPVRPGHLNPSHNF